MRGQPAQETCAQVQWRLVDMISLHQVTEFPLHWVFLKFLQPFIEAVKDIRNAIPFCTSDKALQLQIIHTSMPISLLFKAFIRSHELFRFGSVQRTMCTLWVTGCPACAAQLHCAASLRIHSSEHSCFSTVQLCVCFSPVLLPCSLEASGES